MGKVAPTSHHGEAKRKFHHSMEEAAVADRMLRAPQGGHTDALAPNKLLGPPMAL